MLHLPFSTRPILTAIFWIACAAWILPEVAVWRVKRSSDSSQARDHGSLNLIVILWWVGIAMAVLMSSLLPQAAISPTRVLEILQPRSPEDVRDIIRTAQKDRRTISICGGRHAMGGQEFGTDTVLVDVRKLNRILNLNRETGIIEVEAGIEWPQLIDGYLARQSGDKRTWIDVRRGERKRRTIALGLCATRNRLKATLQQLPASGHLARFA